MTAPLPTLRKKRPYGTRRCEMCRGTGEKVFAFGKQAAIYPCPDCDGKGWVKL